MANSETVAGFDLGIGEGPKGILKQVFPPKHIDLETKRGLRDHYDKITVTRDRFRKKNRYYYEQLIKYLRFIIPPGKNVLEVGCGDGYVLRQLEPAQGLGIDLSPAMISRARSGSGGDIAGRIEYQQADIETTTFDQTFDYILLSDLIGTLVDIQQALENLRSACGPHTRVIIHNHSMLWEPVLKAAEKLGFKMPSANQNWLSPSDIENFMALTGYELVNTGRWILMPKRIPVLSNLINRSVAPLPLINRLCLTNCWVARVQAQQPIADHSTTVLIPCRNEKGNIRPAIERIPSFGRHQEIIFVDGHSTDGTVEEIKAVIAENPDKDIKLFEQKGKGKGDAVRLGFANANEDILMILDADLTVPPEDLPKFYHAIASGKGEFINGSRLVYPMESEAMRFLNILGNKFFSVALSWLTNQKFKDTLCGTKVIFRSDYQKLQEGRSYFGDFDPFGDFDLLFGASKLNLKIIEIPIRYRDRAYGSTNISRFRHGWLLLKMSFYAFKKLKAC